MNPNKLSIESNEKIDHINFIFDEIDKIADEIVNLKTQYKNKHEILNKLSKDILDTNISIDYLNIEINLLKDKIKDAILNLYTNTNLEDTNKKLSEKKDNLNINLLKLDHLGQFILQIEKDLNELQLQIRSNQDYQETLSSLSLLAPYRENTSEITINDLIIKPEWLENFVDTYNNDNIPKELLDKIIFLKWWNNSNKHSIIKALWNGLDRPIFRVRYDDYFNEFWLYNIFITLTEHIKSQKKIKNENIEEYNTIIDTIEQIENWNYGKDPNNNIIINDVSWNIYDIDMSDKSSKRHAINILQNSLNQIKDYINQIEDSCILYVDDLDKVISSSVYSKWNLLWPIKNIINEIKTEGHNIILILIWDNLWNNHNDFKTWIDKVFELEWINNNYTEVFNKIIMKYEENLSIRKKIPNLNINSLPNDYNNIKFLDKLARRVMHLIIKWDKINQDIFEKELSILIDEEKKLYIWVWIKNK